MVKIDHSYANYIDGLEQELRVTTYCLEEEREVAKSIATDRDKALAEIERLDRSIQLQHGLNTAQANRIVELLRALRQIRAVVKHCDYFAYRFGGRDELRALCERVLPPTGGTAK